LIPGAGFGRDLGVGQQHIAGGGQDADAPAGLLVCGIHQGSGTQRFQYPACAIGRQVVDRTRVIANSDE